MRALTIVTGLIVLGGCTSRSVSPGPAAAVAPQLSVERFLQAVNAGDLPAMSRIFGTADGPVGETGSSFGCFWKKIGAAFGGRSCRKWNDVELQLDAIAQILRHDNYQLGSEAAVAGRGGRTTRVGVSLEFPNGRRADDVGFFVVRAGDGRWLIEEIELVKVTNST